MNTLQKITLRVLLKDKFIGAAAAALAAVAASYIVSLIPQAPEFVSIALRAALKMPDDVVITELGLVGILSPFFLNVFNALVQEYVLRKNNEFLRVIEPTPYYNGRVDGLVGEKAKAAVVEMVKELENR